MLSVGGLAAAGDSLTDEYADPDQGFPYALTWFEALGASGVNVGDLRVDPDNWGDVREEGYEFNWAQAGATSASLLGEGQHLGLAAQVNAGDVTHAVLAIGQNDYWPLGAAYQGIYDGTWTQPDIEAHNQGILTNIETAVDTLMATGVNLVLSNVIDYGVAPLVRTLMTDPVGRQRVADAIEQLNLDLEVFAATNQILLVDSFALTKTYLGEHGSEIMSQLIGGVEITNTPGVDSDNAFVGDGIHPHTILQCVWGNCFLDAFNLGFGAGLELMSEQEMLDLAGLGAGYTGDTLNIDYSDYVYRFDWGDAPSPYPTQAPAGAVHRILGGFCLGSLIDAEDDGQPTVRADGDDANDLDDEDCGVDPGTLFQRGFFTLTVNITDTRGNGGYLDGWIDLNRDGDWTDADEWFLQKEVSDGPNLLAAALPVDALHAPVGQTYARFRLSMHEHAVDPGGLGTQGEVEDYRVTIVNADLGAVEAEDLQGLDLSAEEHWYRIRTSGPGFLSLVATYTAANGDCELTLLDADGDQIATSATGNGVEVLHHDVGGAGEVYFVKLRGTNNDVDLNMVNLVEDQGDTANVRGTDDADTLKVTIESDPSESSFMIDGVEYNFVDLGVNTLTCDGGGGYDVIEYNGSPGADWVQTWPDHGSFEGGGISVTTENYEDVTANSRGGTDVAQLYGSDQADTFRAGPDSAEMSGLGYHVDANGFLYSHGYPGPLGEYQPGDTAELEGEAGTTDVARAWPGQTRMQGPGFNSRAKGFPKVYVTGTDPTDIVKFYPDGDDDLETRAGLFSGQMTCDTGENVQAQGFAYIFAFSKPGNSDRADLYDSPEKDTFLALPDYSQLYGTFFGNDFVHRVKRFDQVTAHSSGGNDVAVLYDGPGSDVVEGHTDLIKMTYEPGNLVEADNFRWMHARSNEGGNDRVELYDESALVPGSFSATYFLGKPGDSAMYPAGREFYTRVKGFPQVNAYGAGNDDVAVLYDGPGDDTFRGYVDRAAMQYEGGNVAQADNFRWMHGRATDDGLDKALLYDEYAQAPGTHAETWFLGKPGDSWMYSPSYGHLNRVKAFETVGAFGSGDDDTAMLFDSTLDDIYWSYVDRSHMSYGDGTYAYAYDFRKYYGYSENGGTDVARVHDTDAGAVTGYAVRFDGYHDKAEVSTLDFYSRTEGFKELRATLFEDDDLVCLFDDPAGVDYLVIRDATAKFCYDQRDIYVDGLFTLHATSYSVAYRDIISFAGDLFFYGNWNDTLVRILETGDHTRVSEWTGDDTYTVELARAPAPGTVVEVTLGPDTQVGVDVGVLPPLTFTPTDFGPQTVTVTAVDDGDPEGLHFGTITHTAASADPDFDGTGVRSVKVKVEDDD